MSLLEYDFDDLARQVQFGLERLAVSFLRSHGARVKHDELGYHGFEYVELELSFDGHTLEVHQVGRPRGPLGGGEQAAWGEGESFESTFDGWPAVNTPADNLARWLASLPRGEASPERTHSAKDPSNPFATPSASTPTFVPESEPSFNPFLDDHPRQGGSNPFLDADRESKRREMLRRLRGEDDDTSQ